MRGMNHTGQHAGKIGSRIVAGDVSQEAEKEHMNL